MAMESDGEDIDDGDSETAEPAAELALWYMEFPGKIAVDNFHEKENWWSFRGSSGTVKGIKILCRCNLVKRLGPQCAAAIYAIVKGKYVAEAVE